MSYLIEYAKRELQRIGLGPDTSEKDENNSMYNDIMEVLKVFQSQGHSGSSAAYAAKIIYQLMKFEPLTPLTGADDEWMDVGDNIKQNIRYSAVFKSPNRFNGQAYNVNGKVFVYPDGTCTLRLTGSATPITFPYTPHTEYVNVPQP